MNKKKQSKKVKRKKKASKLTAFHKSLGIKLDKKDKRKVIKLKATSQYPFRFKVMSDSVAGAFYTVVASKYGDTRCNCPGFATRRRCKHVFRIIERITDMVS